MDSKEFMQYLSLVPYMNYSTASRNLISQCIVVGKGDYGTAFKLSDGNVGKIYKSYDFGYTSFLKLLRTLTSPHLPRIYDEGSNEKFGFVVLEFLDPLAYVQFLNMSFEDITRGMTHIITGQQLLKPVPSSIVDLSQGMKETAEGYCLDLKEENFGSRDGTLVTIDPFTVKTKTNDHLCFVPKSKVA